MEIIYFILFKEQMLNCLEIQEYKKMSNNEQNLEPDFPTFEPDNQDNDFQTEIDQTAKNAIDGFDKYTNPYQKEQAAIPKMKDIVNVDNAIKGASYLATMGQGDTIKSAVGGLVDGSIELKNHIANAEVVDIKNQELGPESKLNDKQHLEALGQVSNNIQDPSMKTRFDSTISSAENCLDTGGIANIQDPSKPLNKEVDGDFFNDVRLANAASNVLSSAAAVGTGVVGGFVAGQLIDNRKESMIENNRLNNYIEKTEEMIGSCKRGYSEGIGMEGNRITEALKTTSRGAEESIKFDQTGKIADISKSGDYGQDVKHFKPEDEGGQKIIKGFKSSISDKQSSFFDNMDLDAQLSNDFSDKKERQNKNNNTYGL